MGVVASARWYYRIHDTARCSLPLWCSPIRSFRSCDGESARGVRGSPHGLDEAKKTVRIEYDASRLTEPVIYELLRRAGLDIVETMPMFAPPLPPEPVAAT